jgi:hypothetical protein
MGSKDSRSKAQASRKLSFWTFCTANGEIYCRCFWTWSASRPNYQQALERIYNLSDIDTDLISKVGGSIYGLTCGFVHAKMVSDIEQLALFYQKAREITSR